MCLTNEEQKTLFRYAESFLGYGDLNAPYWLIGMEEGGGTKLAEIRCRLHAWQKLNYPTVADLLEFHKQAGMAEVVEQTIQRTWKYLIDLLCAIGGEECSNKLEYQRCHLGKYNGNSCLLELLPLPSRNINVQNNDKDKPRIYKTCNLYDCIQNKGKYKKHFFPLRTEILKKQIKEHEPQLVVFYGKTYIKHWKTIADCAFSEQDRCFFLGKNDKTLFAIICHPCARGASQAMFQNCGRKLSNMLKGG